MPTRVRHLLLGEAEVLDELLVGGGLLERVEVLAVEVLDQRLLERRRRRRRSRTMAGMAVEAGPLGRPPPPLPGDQLVGAVAGRPDQDRLQHAELADRGGQRRQRLLVEVPARGW